MINCCEECMYQNKGYCNLEGITIVHETKGRCPHRIKNLKNGDSVADIANSNKVDSLRDIGSKLL